MPGTYAPARLPKDVDVEIVGARDIRVMDMKQSEKGGTFVVNTTKATDPADTICI